MNINDSEAKVIASAVDLFVKQDMSIVSAMQKDNLNKAAIEAKAIIATKGKEINLSHIQALSIALELYIENMKKSIVANPQSISIAEALSAQFNAILEPLLDNQ